MFRWATPRQLLYSRGNGATLLVRSALLALCVLVARGEEPLAAMERVKRARGVVSPSPAQLEAFAAFSREVRAERGAAWDVPSVEGLGNVAWRHLREGASREETRASSTQAP